MCGLSRILQWGRTFGVFDGTTTWIWSTELCIFKYPKYSPFDSLTADAWWKFICSWIEFMRISLMLLSSWRVESFLCTLFKGIQRELSTEIVFGLFKQKKTTTKRSMWKYIGYTKVDMEECHDIAGCITLMKFTQLSTTVPWESLSGLWKSCPKSVIHRADCIWHAAVRSFVRKCTAEVAFRSISALRDLTSSHVQETYGRQWSFWSKCQQNWYIFSFSPEHKLIAKAKENLKGIYDLF